MEQENQMKKLIVIGFIMALLIGCEYPVGEINRWWREDVLKTQEEEKETATVTIELEWE